MLLSSVALVELNPDEMYALSVWLRFCGRFKRIRFFKVFESWKGQRDCIFHLQSQEVSAYLVFHSEMSFSPRSAKNLEA